MEECVPWGHWRTWPVTTRTLCYWKDIWWHCHPIWEGRQSILPVPPRLYMRPPSTFASFTRAQGATMCFFLFILCVRIFSKTENQICGLVHTGKPSTTELCPQPLYVSEMSLWRNHTHAHTCICARIHTHTCQRKPVTLRIAEPGESIAG